MKTILAFLALFITFHFIFQNLEWFRQWVFWKKILLLIGCSLSSIALLAMFVFAF